jgi:hypothetical protein
MFRPRLKRGRRPEARVWDCRSLANMRLSYDMITKKTVELLLFMFVSYAAASHAQDNDPVPSGVFFGDIRNVAIGAFNLKKDSYLFAMPKDSPPTDRGLIWGEMLIVEDGGKKHPFVSIFDCGPVISHFTPVVISFSKEDKYLIVESGGEGGAVLDVFDAGDLFVGSLENGWNGTGECVKPIATLGSHNMPVGFEGWDGYVPIVSSTVPLDRVSTSEGVWEYEKQGKCCGEDWKTFLWDIGTDKFTPIEAPQGASPILR